MSLNRIRWVIGVSIVALLGILFIQGFWIHKSWTTYLYNYNHRVRQAAVHTAHRLEKGQVKKFLRERNHWTHRKGSRPYPDPHPNPTPRSARENVHLNIVTSDGNEKTNIIVINGDTIQETRVITRSGPDQGQIAIWNTHVDEIEVEEYISDSALLASLQSPQIDSILKLELEQEDLNYAYSYEIISTNDSNFDQRMHGRKLGKALVPLFRKSTDREPVYLQVQVDQFRAGLPRWLIAMIVLSILFSSVMIWAFWFVIQGLLKQKKIAEVKTDFINNMTHEFKTPISTISLAADSIQMDQIKNNPKQVSYYSDIIKQESKRMNNQVEKVLQAAQMERGKMQFSIEEVDLVELTKGVIASFELLLKEKQGEIAFSSNLESLRFNADPQHLSNLISNLLDNAIKYCDEAPRISIDLSSNKTEIELTVKDNGIGMSREEQQHLFSKFFRARQGDLHQVKGFGLGLNYVKYVVEEMGGSIDVKSAKGVGSKFTIRWKTT